MVKKIFSMSLPIALMATVLPQTLSPILALDTDKDTANRHGDRERRSYGAVMRE